MVGIPLRSSRKKIRFPRSRRLYVKESLTGWVTPYPAFSSFNSHDPILSSRMLHLMFSGLYYIFEKVEVRSKFILKN